jgi:hypothetical protein
MIRKALIAAALTGAVAGISTAAAAEEFPVEWTISSRTGETDGMVQLSLNYRAPRGGHSMHSSPRLLSDLQGLTAAHLASAGGPAAFRIDREAGTLDCRGVAGAGRGAGECSFRPNTNFAAALERRGIGRPSVQQQYHLAMQGVGMPLVTELERQGYGPLTIDELVSAGIHRVSIPYVRSLADAGYRLDSIDKLISFAIHRVDAEYIRGIEPLNGEARFSPDEIISMRIHRVSADQARALAALGYRGLTHRQLMSMAIHRVTPDYIRAMADAGFRDLTPDQLVSMRIHRVTPEFAKEMQALARDGISADQLVSMRIHGLGRSARRR